MTSEHEESAIRRDVMVTPHDDRRGPGVLVVHSGRGLTEFIEQVCGRLAHHGYVGYAIDLFDGELPDTIQEAERLKAPDREAASLARLEDAVSFLSNFRGVSREAIGVLGIGHGGELALKLAEHDPEALGAVVVYYGHADVDWGGIRAPFLGHYAELDPEIPRRMLRDAQERMQDRGRHCDFKLYAGVKPSFFEEEATAHHDPAAARKSWNITLDFLEQTLFEGR